MRTGFSESILPLNEITSIDKYFPKFTAQETLLNPDPERADPATSLFYAYLNNPNELLRAIDKDPLAFPNDAREVVQRLTQGESITALNEYEKLVLEQATVDYFRYRPATAKKLATQHKATEVPEEDPTEPEAFWWLR